MSSRHLSLEDPEKSAHASADDVHDDEVRETPERRLPIMKLTLKTHPDTSNRGMASARVDCNGPYGHAVWVSIPCVAGAGGAETEPAPGRKRRRSDRRLKQ